MYAHMPLSPSQNHHEVPRGPTSQNLTRPILTSHLFPILKIFHYFLLVHCTYQKNSIYPLLRRFLPPSSFTKKSDIPSRTLVSSAAISRGSSFSSYSACTTRPGVVIHLFHFAASRPLLLPPTLKIFQFQISLQLSI